MTRTAVISDQDGDPMDVVTVTGKSQKDLNRKLDQWFEMKYQMAEMFGRENYSVTEEDDIQISWIDETPSVLR